MFSHIFIGWRKKWKPYNILPQHGIHDLIALTLTPKPSHVIVCDMLNAL
jgi:hypothetical protein